MGLVADFDELAQRAADACRAHFGDRLVSVAVFGSVGRGTPGPYSDVDLLVVLEELPTGRFARQASFEPVERAVAPFIESLRRRGIETRLSPVLKTRAEAEAGSPLFLDMVEDARILYDREGFLAARLQRLRKRLSELGARRIPYAGAWYWDLKPDWRAGEVLEL